MNYDFETRNPSENVVHEFLAHSGITDPAIIPYSVAEMRFNIAPEIKSALLDCVEKGSFGYAMAGEDYKKAVCGWMEKRHGWQIQPDWIIQTYGVVAALDTCVKAFTEKDDGVLIQTPVYPPFFNVVKHAGRKLLTNKLHRVGDSYVIDFADFEKKAKEAKLFILCSPHNPVGRVWTRSELIHMGRICLENGVIVVADEIHHDLLLPGYSHTVTAKALPELEDKCVICTAPSKTFNLAGLATSNIIIKNPEMRKTFKDHCEMFVNVPGTAACQAAYTLGTDWLEALLGYLDENRRIVEDFVKENLPEIKVFRLEGTYLMWLDMSGLGLDRETLHNLLKNKAQLLVNEGESFGEGGEGFIRLNIACPRRYVNEALTRLKEALRG